MVTDNPYVSILNDEQKRKQREMQASMRFAVSVNPDEHAKVIDLSGRSGISPDLVKNNIQDVEKSQQVKSIDYRTIQDLAPRLSNFIMDPQRAAMVQDEVPFWQEVEEYWSDMKEAFSSGEQQVRTADLRWRQLMSKVGMDERLTDDEIAELEGYQAPTGNPADDYSFLSGIPIVTAEQLPIFAKTLSSGAEYGMKGAMAGAGAGAGAALVAGQLGPQVALPEELATVPAGAVAGFGIGGRSGFQLGMVMGTIQLEAGLAFDEYARFQDVDGNKIDEDIAAMASIVTGVANGALEFVGDTAILKNFPGINKLLPFADAGQMKKLLASQTFRSVMKGAAKRFAKTAATEGTTEALQELVTIVSGEIAKGVDDGEFNTLTSDEIIQRVGEAGYKGAQGGIGISAPGIGAQSIIDARRVQQAHKHQQKVSERINKILGSKLAERNPNMMEELYQSVADDNGDGEVGISVAPVLNQLQEAGIDPIGFFDQMGVSDQELFEAVRDGGDINVKAGKLLTAIKNNDMSDVVLASIRKTPDAMTALEAEDLVGRVEKDAQKALEQLDLDAQAQQEMEARANEVFDAVSEAMSQGGVESVGGQRYAVAELYRAYAMRQMADWAAEGREFDAVKFYSDLGLTFKREGFVEADKKNISDIQMSGLLNELRGLKESQGKLERDAFGPSVSEVARKLGISDDRGDLFGQDVDVNKNPFMKNMLRDDGIPIDDLGEYLFERGYFQERPTENDVIQAILEDMTAQSRDARKFSQEYLNQNKADRLASLEALREEVDRAGLNLDEMSNEEIIAAISDNNSGEGELLQPQQEQSIVDAANEALKDAMEYSLSKDNFDFDEWLYEQDFYEDRDGSPRSIEGITEDQAQGREDFTLTYDELTDEQKDEVNSILHYMNISVDEVEFKVSYFDADYPEDNIASIDLKDYHTVRDRVEAELFNEKKVHDIDEAFSHSSHHVRAAAFRAALDQIGIEYRKAGYEAISSEYVYIPYEFDENGDADEELKVRFADHENQSIHHERADYNLVGVIGSNETLNVLREIRDKLGIGQEQELYQSTEQAQRNNIGLYSQVEQVVLDMNLPGFKPSKKNPNGAAPSNEIWAKVSKAPGVKAEEIETLGLEDFLKSGDRFTRDEVVSFIRSNGVVIEETIADQETAGDGQLQFDSGEVWDDPKAWEWRIDDYVDDPEMAGFDVDQEREEIVDRLVQEEKSYIDNAIGDDADYEARVEYVERDFADKIQKGLEDAIQENAEERAKAEYEDDPIYIYRTAGDNADVDLIIFGNDDQGYDVRTSMHDRDVVASDIWSLSEAKIQAAEYAHDNDLISSEDDESVSRWSEYTMEGDFNNYREIKLKLPEVEGDFYEEAHFPDRNVVAFLRVDDRDIVINEHGDNRAAYFIDEFQSDWHQKGRKYGYQTGRDAGELEEKAINMRKEFSNDVNNVLSKEVNSIEAITEFKVLAARHKVGGAIDGSESIDQLIVRASRNQGLENGVAKEIIDTFKSLNGGNDAINKLIASLDLEKQEDAERYGVPSAPFKGNAWMQLGLKRAIVDAVDNGYEAIAWADAGTLMDRWSSSYAELYKTQYDTKMPSMIKKLTKQQPKHFDADGNPWNNYVFKEGFATEEELIEEAKHHDHLTNPDGELYMELKPVQAEDGTWNLEDPNPPEINHGYWIIEITPELKERVQSKSYPLFQPGIPSGSTPYQGATSPRGGIRGDFGDFQSTYEIFTTPKANMSTLLHETGHLFLEMLHREANMEGAPERVKENYHAALAFLGVDDFASIETEHHEKWARTFEVYLREGKAPSARLERAFNKFRAWLINVYRRLTGQYDIEISDDVRSVFDRLIATDDEIQATEAQNIFKPSADISELMTDSERASYMRTAQEAHDEAVTDALRRKIHTEQREATKWWKSEREKARKEIADDLWQQPVYQAWHFLTKGEFYNTETPKDLKGLRLNRQKLIDAIGTEGVLQDMPRTVPPMWRKNGGLHPDELAEMVGYASGYELIQDMINSENPTKAIERLTDNRMEREFPKPDVAQEATEAVFSDKRALFLASELKALRRKAGDKFMSSVVGRAARSPLTVIRNAVDRVLNEKPIKEITKPFVYLNNSQRAAKKAQQAIVDGDYEAAATAKAQQLFNYEMFRAALDVKEKSEKIRKKINDRANKKINPAKVAPEYIEQIKAIANAIRRPEDLNSTAQLKAAVEWAKARENDVDDPANIAIPAMYEGSYEAVGYRDMTFRELQDLNTFIATLWEEGRRHSDDTMEAYRQKDEELAGRVLENVKRTASSPIGKSSSRQAIEDGFGQFLAMHVKTTQFLREMDGYEEQGYVWSEFMGRAADMEAAEITMMEEKMPELRDIFSRYFTKTELARLHMQKVKLGNLGKLSTVTRAQLLSLALNFGNEENIQAVEDGYGVKREELFTAIDKFLEKRDWQFVQEAWDYIDSFWPEIKELEKRMTGVAPAKVEALPIETRHGSFRGGYYPLKYDQRLSIRADVNQASDKFKQMVGGRTGRANTRHGHTKNRVGSGGQAVRLDLDVMFGHVNDVIHDLAYREGVLEMNRLLNGKQFTDAITETFGSQVHKQMRDWLIEVGAGHTEPTNVIMKGVRRLRVGTTIVTMGMSLSTAAVQILGLASTLARLGTVQTIKGVGKFYKNPVAGSRFVWDNSPFMRQRFNNFDRDVNSIANSVKIGGVKDDIVRFAFMGIGVMDLMVSMPTWVGAYEQGMQKFDGDHKKASKHADAVVSESQGSGAKKDLAGIMRGNDGQRLLTMFMSYFSAMHNLLRENAVQLKNRNISPQKFALNMLYLVILPPIIEGFMRGNEPDDDDEWAEWAAKKIGGYSVSTLVGVRDLAQLWASDYGYQFSPATSTTEKALSGASGMVEKLLDGGEPSDWQVKQSATLIGILTGLPTKKIYEQFDYWMDVLDGEEKSSARGVIFNKRD